MLHVSIISQCEVKQDLTFDQISDQGSQFEHDSLAKSMFKFSAI